MTKEQTIIVSLIGHDTHNDFIIMLSWNCSFLFLMIKHSWTHLLCWGYSAQNILFVSIIIFVVYIFFKLFCGRESMNEPILE
jgi:hypothetical protein